MLFTFIPYPTILFLHCVSDVNNKSLINFFFFLIFLTSFSHLTILFLSFLQFQIRNFHLLHLQPFQEFWKMKHSNGLLFNESSMKPTIGIKLAYASATISIISIASIITVLPLLCSKLDNASNQLMERMNNFEVLFTY